MCLRFQSILFTLLLSSLVLVLALDTAESRNLSTSILNQSSFQTMTLGFYNSTVSARVGAPNPHVYRSLQVPLDVERYPIAPPGLVLEQVHVYVRHGELQRLTATFLYSESRIVIRLAY